VIRQAPWQVVIFSLDMSLLVYSMSNARLATAIAGLLKRSANDGVCVGGTFGTGIMSAVLSSAMNNMPTVLFGALSIETTGATGPVRAAMIYANVIGCDLGPKITPIGSLATPLCLHVLGQKGVKIGWGYYFYVDIALTNPILLATLAALALRLTLV